jgi:hypothetical protein
VPLQIVRSSGKAQLTGSGVDLKKARVLWESAGGEPMITNELTLSTPNPVWIEAEALLPDGRLGFAATNSSPPRTAQKVQR